MAMEREYCPECYGSGKAQYNEKEHTETCNLGHKHIIPAVVKNITLCKKCGGTGIILVPNFGRQ